MNPADGDRHPLSHEAAAELHNEGVAHEHSDVNIRAILMFAGGLVVVAVIVQVAMWLLFGVFEKRAAANDPLVSPLAAPPAAMPHTTAASPSFGEAAGPQLLTDEPRALQLLHARERRDLESYGWIDQRNGVARIPIEQAEKLLIERGLPVRSTGQADPNLGTHGPALGEASSGRAIPIPKETSQPAAAPAAQKPGAGAQPAGSAMPPAAGTQKPGGGA